MSGIAEAFVAIVGPGGVLTEPAEVQPFATDWFGRFRGHADAVILPRNTGEVAAVLAHCSQNRIVVVPQGGNTSVCGGSVPDADAARTVVLSLSRLNAVRDLDPVSNTITVEAGCVLARVQHVAEEAGRLFPLSLSAEGSCQIGGTISTNAGGMSVARYGTMRDLVLGLEVVLPDGRVWDGLRTVRKDSSGYDLKGLWIGAEGTLGVITAAALKLFPLPPARATAWLGLPHPDAALTVLARLREVFDAGLVATELMSHTIVDVVLRHVGGTRPPLASQHAWHLLVELAGADGDRLGRELEDQLGAMLEQGLAGDAVVAQSKQHAAEFWRVRHDITDALKAAGASLTHDVAVPLSAVPAYIRHVDEIVSARFGQALGTVVCHLGDGNVHYNLTFPRQFWDELADPELLASEVSDALQEVAMALGGTFVAEHGVGRKFRKAAARFKSEVERDLVHQLKHMLDPLAIMNPGRVLPP